MSLKRLTALLLAGALALCAGCARGGEENPSTGGGPLGTDTDVVPYEGTYERARLTRADGLAVLEEYFDRRYPDRFTLSETGEQLDCDGRIYYVYELADADGTVEKAAVDEESGAQYRYNEEYQMLDQWDAFAFYTDEEEDWHSWAGTYESADGEVLIINRLVDENFQFEIVGGVFDYCYIFGSFAQTIYGDQKCYLSGDEQTLTLVGTHNETYTKVSDSTEYMN